jgi:DNA repair protein RadC
VYDDGIVRGKESVLGYVQTAFSFEGEQEAVAEALQIRQLHEGLAPYLDTQLLRRLIAERLDVYEALRSPTPPLEVQALLVMLSALIQPRSYEQISSPDDVAALLMVQMGHLDQEELRTVLLDTKNHVQGIETIYRGSLNSSAVRVGEVYKAALRRNSAAIIVAHNHPSGDPTPSPEDIAVTRQIIEAGQLLDVDCLDHLIIGQGTWTSMRKNGLWLSR